MNRFLNGIINSAIMHENVKYSLTAISFIAIKSHRTNQEWFLCLGYGIHRHRWKNRLQTHTASFWL